ncbi:unnamed protein product [Calypogeia fissa]
MRIIPMGLSRLLFEIRDGQFSLTEEGDPQWCVPSIIGVKYLDSYEDDAESRSERRFWLLYERAMWWFSISDYKVCQETLCEHGTGLVLRPLLQGLLLQLMGMSKLGEGDHTGALNDLTSALWMFSDAADLRSYACLCWKERGWVNFLLGNFQEAQKDCKMVLTLHPESLRDPAHLKGKLLAKELVTYIHSFADFKGKKLDIERITIMLSILKPWTYPAVRRSCPTYQVMKMVRQKAYPGALAVWYNWGVNQVPGSSDDLFYLQVRGIIKRLGGDLQGALEDLTVALRVDPEDYECLKHRAHVKHLLKDEHGARLDFRIQSVVVDPFTCLAMMVLRDRQLVFQ